MIKKQFVRFAITLTALLPALTFMGCKKEKDAEPARAKVMVVHASPNNGPVDVLIDNNRVTLTPLSFTNVTAGNYLEVNAGARNIKVTAAGNVTLIDANPTLEADKNYSIFAINTSSNPGVQSAEALVITDDLMAPATGMAKVRFLHLAPDAPAVDIVAVAGSIVIPLVQNLAYKGTTNFTPVTAGTYNLEVRVAGTTTRVLDLPNTSIAAGKILTVFARGFRMPPSGNTNTLAIQQIEHQPVAPK
jgi:hypothetical protein